MPRWLSHIVLLTLLCGCSPAMYMPNSHLAPLFEAPGEVHTWARIGFGSPIVALDLEGELQAAISLLNHLSVFTSTAFGPQHKIGEIGAGTYLRVNRLFRTELLAGYGQGTVQAEGIYRHQGDGPLPFLVWLVAPGERYTITSDYKRLFAQLNVGLDLSPADVLGVAVKLSNVRLFNIKVDPVSVHNARGYYLEPALFARIGRGAIATEGQFGFNIPLQETSMETFDGRTFYVSMGLHLRVDAIYKRMTQ